jgi:hypothetical protein
MGSSMSQCRTCKPTETCCAVLWYLPCGKTILLSHLWFSRHGGSVRSRRAAGRPLCMGSLPRAVKPFFTPLFLTLTHLTLLFSYLTCHPHVLCLRGWYRENPVVLLYSGASGNFISQSFLAAHPDIVSTPLHTLLTVR